MILIDLCSVANKVIAYDDGSISHLNISSFFSPDEEKKIGIIFFEIASDECKDLQEQMEAIAFTWLNCIKNSAGKDNIFDEKKTYGILWLALNEMTFDFKCSVDTGITVLNSDLPSYKDGEFHEVEPLFATDVIHKEFN